jgi:hypothetical protein
MAPGSEVTVSIPEWRAPLLIRARTSDPDVFRQVVVRRELELEFDVVPQRIINAGANIGISVCILAERWPEARILANELEAGNFDLLVRNSAPYARVTVKHGGLSLINNGWRPG